MRKHITNILNNSYFEKFIISLIVLNFVVFIFDTDVAFHNKYTVLIRTIEFFSVILFTIEYFLRLCVLNSIKDVFKPMMLIDLLAIAPFYIASFGVNTVFLRIARLSKLASISKLARYSDALNNIKNAFLKKQNEIKVTLAIFVSSVTVFSILIYFAEHKTGSASFSSIPSSFWWSVITFTSVGYGDAYPVTTIGKFIGGTAAILGVGVHGLLIGIIGSAFIEGIKDKPKKQQSPEKELVKF